MWCIPEFVQRLLYNDKSLDLMPDFCFYFSIFWTLGINVVMNFRYADRDFSGLKFEAVEITMITHAIVLGRLYSTLILVQI